MEFFIGSFPCWIALSSSYIARVVSRKKGMLGILFWHHGPVCLFPVLFTFILKRKSKFQHVIPTSKQVAAHPSVMYIVLLLSSMHIMGLILFNLTPSWILKQMAKCTLYIHCLYLVCIIYKKLMKRLTSRHSKRALPPMEVSNSLIKSFSPFFCLVLYPPWCGVWFALNAALWLLCRELPAQKSYSSSTSSALTFPLRRWLLPLEVLEVPVPGWESSAHYYSEPGYVQVA